MDACQDGVPNLQSCASTRIEQIPFEMGLHPPHVYNLAVMQEAYIVSSSLT